MQTLVTSYEFWNFEDNPEFVGTYVEKVVLNEENEPFSVFVFEDEKGEFYYIPEYYLIDKALQKINFEKRKLKIVFLGKKDNFNRFNIYLI